MVSFREPTLPRGYGPRPSGYRFVPYHHASPPDAAQGPLKAYEPTRNVCPFLCGLFPCMCTNRRPPVQSYNDPLIQQTTPFSGPPQAKQERRASAPSSFLQRLLRLGSNSKPNDVHSRPHHVAQVEPTRPARTPPSNPYPPSGIAPRPAARTRTSAIPPATTRSRRRNSTPEYTQAYPQPLATQTPVVQPLPIPRELPNTPAAWYRRPGASWRPDERTSYPLSRSAVPTYTPQVEHAVLPDVTHASTRREPVSSRPRRRKVRSRPPITATSYATPATHGTQRREVPVAPVPPHGTSSAIPPGLPTTTYVAQTSPYYQRPPSPPAEDPLYFANHSHNHLSWLAPECRLPRAFVFKRRHFWSVAQAVAWLKAHAAGDLALAGVIKNIDANLPKREFERRAANLSNAICTPAGWVQGLAGVYRSVALAAFKSDEAGVRTLLLETGHRELVWDAPDWDWGRGGNRYGRVLVEVRSQLRQDVHNGAHREMEYRMPPQATPRAAPTSSSRHHRRETVYPFTGYTDLRPRPSRSGQHHVQFNPTPMVRII